MNFVASTPAIISASVENCRWHIWECAVLSSLPGTIIDTQSHSFEPHENFDNIAEACFLEFHAAIMKKEREMEFSDFYWNGDGIVGS